MKTKYNLLSLLEKYEVIVPAIQRDYAFGRKDESDKRDGFVDVLVDGLRREQGVHLDFIYGKKDEFNHLILLDGQQRITTLWLFAVYLNRENELLQHFSYDTRTSSRDFCLALLENQWNVSKINEEGSYFDEKWFFHSWRNDPTITGMVEMLRTIDKRRGELPQQNISLLEKITFSFLDIEELGEPEELYLKMNSRGKQLSEWDNFKADLFELSCISDEFKKSVDTDLVDLFWEINQENSPFENTEKSLLKLCCNAIRVEAILNAENLSVVDSKEKITTLSKKSWKELIDPNALDKFWRFIKDHQDLKVEFSRFENDRLKMDELIKSLLGNEETEMSATDLALFAAYYLFSKHREYDEENLKQTIRIISNYLDVAPRSDYAYIPRYIRNIESVIKETGSILENARNVLDHNDEENEKAKLSDDWMNLIYLVEREDLSAGTVRWLLRISDGDLAKATTYYEETFTKLFINNQVASSKIVSDLWSYTTELDRGGKLPLGNSAHSDSYSWWTFFHDGRSTITIKEYVDNNYMNYYQLNTSETANWHRQWIAQAPTILDRWKNFSFNYNGTPDSDFIREGHKTGGSYKWQLQIQVLHERLKELNIDLKVVANKDRWAEYYATVKDYKIKYEKDEHFHIYYEKEVSKEVFVDTGETVAEKLDQTIDKVSTLVRVNSFDVPL